ncbi:hypothetical protein BGX20_010337 [Mortierella sp. AD010]|nr:hypothetical protein BGX20_010337 [Mortierella sp. AD010]
MAYQSNAVTPNEFLARAEKLLDPEQFEILDGIRRKHVPRPSDGTSAQQSPNASATNSAQGTPSPSAATSQISMPSTSQGLARTVPGTSLPTATPGFPSTPSASQPQPASIAAASLPPTSATTPQSAPVRKRNTDTTTAAATPTESKVASKRVKTDHQTLVPGGSATQPGTPAALPSFPRTPGTSTPVGAASPGVFSQVSLPGQQKAAVITGAGVSGTAGGSGSAGAGGAGAGAAGRSSAAGVEKVNFENITDVMGYVGVDLKEESDNIMRDNDGYSRSSGGDGQDRTRVQNFVNNERLKVIVERIAGSHKLTNIEPDVLAYLAMAAQERLRGLAEQMILASKHRARSLPTAPPPMYDEDHPMYKVEISQDVKRQLLAIERVEREEETKRKEQIAERERRLAAGEDPDESVDSRGGAGASGGASGAGGAKKGKKQKEGGPGVSARNMSEEARKKVANQTALGFAGGSGRSYSWMMGSGGGGGGAGGDNAGAASPSVSTPGASGTAASAGSPSASGGVSIGGSGAAGAGSVKPGLVRGSTMPASSSSSSLMGSGSASLGGGISGTGVTSHGLTPSSLSRSAGGGSMILPPSTLGRPSGLRDAPRKVNVRDALFCLERDRGGGGGEGSGQRVLVKSYVKWLK